MDIPAFGSALRQLRRELRLSQLDLAGELGTTQRHVSFLETGRSSPSRAMIGRLATGLRLSAAQRATLFSASGFRNPYRQREFGSDEVQAALDMIESRILAHWPFPAFLLDESWTVLRHNSPAAALLAGFGAPAETNAPVNILSVLLSERMVSMISNWQEARTALYFRVQTQSENNPPLRAVFDEAVARGLFEGIAESLVSTADIPIYIPVEMDLGNGLRFRFTSLVGQLASVHDAIVEGFEIELLAPVDDASEKAMRTMLAGSSVA